MTNHYTLINKSPEDSSYQREFTDQKLPDVGLKISSQNCIVPSTK